MNKQQIIDYIIEVDNKTISKAMNYWLDSCDRFNDFTFKYRDKIRRKVRGAKTDEDLEDVRFELEIPWLFLSDERFDIEYEKFGDLTKRAPDFTVCFKGTTEFNIEVKRIREGSLGSSYEDLISEIAEEIRKIPSSLGFSLDVTSLDNETCIVKRMKTKKNEIITFIKATILAEEKKIAYDTRREYRLKGFEKEIILLLSRPSGKVSTDHTSYHGGSFPIFYTDKESYKFSDTIFYKLGQMIPDMINLIVITTNSSTHEPEDLLDCIYSINKLIEREDEDFFIRKGFSGIQDFLQQSSNLSGILFKTTWTDAEKNFNLLWCNEQAAHKIPVNIKEYLKVMGKMQATLSSNNATT